MRVVAVLLAVLVAGAGVFVFSNRASHSGPDLVLGCKHVRAGGGEREREEREREGRESEGRDRGASPVGDYFSGPDDDPGCETGGIEGFGDLMKANSAQLSRDVAPGTQVRPGAFRAAAHSAAALPTVGGSWN